MPYNNKGQISLNQLSDEQNALLNRLAYAGIIRGWDRKIDGKPRTILEALPERESVLADEIKAAGLGDLLIKDYVNNNGKSGFCAIAFEDPYTGDVGMSFRGTEELEALTEDGSSLEEKIAAITGKDMLDNGATMTVGLSPQVREAFEFYKNNRNKDGSNHFYGHSKGGEIASEVYSLNYEEIAGIHIINAQPINPWKLSPGQIAAFYSDKFDSVIVDGDIVSFLGSVVYPSRHVKDKYPNDGLFGSHEVESIDFDDNGNAIIEKRPFSAESGKASIIAKIANKILSAVQRGLLPVTVIAGIIIRVVDYFKNDMPKMVEQFREHWNQLFDRIQEIYNDASQAKREFVGSLINGLTEVFRISVNPGYRYATSHPVIKVDTYKLRNYADRLGSVNKRIKNLDSRMDSLYWKVGFVDLLSLLHADLMTHKSLSLTLCASYLNSTADDFETAERNILNKL